MKAQNTFKLLIISMLVQFSLFEIPCHAETNKFDNLMQAKLDHYLQISEKPEAVTGMSLLISYPYKHKAITKHFFAGKISRDANAKPIDKNSIFEIGSITKSYAAAIILQLEAEGLLSTEDTIGKWFPQYPMWKDVAIKQLLDMTSGIPSYSSNPKFVDFLQSHLTYPYDNQYVLTYADSSKPISIGTKFEYSNTNFILSSLIIEAVTGKSFADALRTRIFDPLHLNNTYYPAGKNWETISKSIAARKVHGYLYDQDENKILDLSNVNLSWAGASGAIVSTVDDQLTWVKALYHGKIFKENSRQKALDELKTIVSVETGQPIKEVTKDDKIGFGLAVYSLYGDDQRFWAYAGSTLAFRMMYLWKPCNDVVVLVALNGKNSNQKAGEDRTVAFLLDIYKSIVENNPALACTD